MQNYNKIIDNLYFISHLSDGDKLAIENQGQEYKLKVHSNTGFVGIMMPILRSIYKCNRDQTIEFLENLLSQIESQKSELITTLHNYKQSLDNTNVHDKDQETTKSNFVERLSEENKLKDKIHQFYIALQQASDGLRKLENTYSNNIETKSSIQRIREQYQFHYNDIKETVIQIDASFFNN